MTPREILIGIADILQTKDLGDRDIEAAGIDQASKFRKHLGIRRLGISRRLDAVFRGRREVDDRIDPIGRDAEFERQLHIAAAESVDEGIDLVSRCGSDPVRNAFSSISNRDHTVIGEPGMVCRAGETDEPQSSHGRLTTFITARIWVSTQLHRTRFYRPTETTERPLVLGLTPGVPLAPETDDRGVQVQRTGELYGQFKTPSSSRRNLPRSGCGSS